MDLLSPRYSVASPAWPQPGQPVVVLLKDGQKLQGTLLSRDADGIAPEVSGARMQLPASSIDQLAPPGSVAAAGRWPRDANRTRYLYSPSGFMLRQGEGYVSQTEIWRSASSASTWRSTPASSSPTARWRRSPGSTSPGTGTARDPSASQGS